VASSGVAWYAGLPRPRPRAAVSVAQRWLPILVGVLTPAVIYLFMYHRSPLIVVGLAVALPLLALLRPAAVTLLLIPLCLLGPATSRGGQAILGASAVLAVGVALHVACGFAALRRSHAWIAAFGLVVLVSYAFPVVSLPGAESRLFNLVGLVIGLGLLAVAVAVPPSGRHVAAVTAVAGAAAAGYALVVGGDLHGRLQGLHLNPNYLGALVAVPLVAAVGLATATRRPVWLLAALPCLTALFATRSRGAMIAAAAGLFVLYARRGWRRQPLLVVAAVVAGLAVLSGFVDVAAVPLGRSTAELEYNNAVRAGTARFALEVALSHPLRGIGYSMYPSLAASSHGIGLYINTHNDYLRLAAESGGAALALFLVLLWLGIRGGQRSPDAPVLRAIVVAYAVGLLFANTLANLTVTAPFWVALGCLIAGYRQRGEGSSRRRL
jgi:O-Antigen ligase